MGAWRLATPAVDFGPGQNGDRSQSQNPGDRPLENDRQPPALSLGAMHLSHSRGWMARSEFITVALDAIHSCNDRNPVPDTFLGRSERAPRRSFKAKSLSRHDFGSLAGMLSRRAYGHVYFVPGMAHV